MMKKYRMFPVLLLIVLIQAPRQLAQDSPPDTGAVATKLAESVSPLKPASVDLPKGEGAWAVRVIRTGGFTGSLLDITVTSNGAVTCSSRTAVTCPKTIAGDAFQAVAALLDPKGMRKTKSSLSDSCRDCYVFRITVEQRDSGKVRYYFAYWDDVTAARAPFQMVRLANAVVALSN